MATKTHDLTTAVDKVTGGSGADRFIGKLNNGFATLNATDLLNGGKGIDTIEATLTNENIGPLMKNIEHGIFTTGDVDEAHLYLKHARQITDLTFRQSNEPHPATTDVLVTDASHVASLTLKHTEDSNYQLTGLDPTVTPDMHLSFNHASYAKAALMAPSGVSFDTLEIDLDRADNITLTGNLGAKTLAIDSTGHKENSLWIQPLKGSGAIRDIDVTGSQDLTMHVAKSGWAHLQTFDSTDFHGDTLWATIGGKHLREITGGASGEYYYVTGIGGTLHSPAKVNLGAGYDSIEVRAHFDAKTQHYNGGADFDAISIDGAADNLNKAVKNFEDVAVDHAQGIYETKGMDITNFAFHTLDGATTVDNLTDRATVIFYEDTSVFLNVNVEGAAGSTTDSLRVLLEDGVALGTQTAGFVAPSLSNLEIDSTFTSHTMYLGSVGSVSDAANVTITGDTHLHLQASNASTSYIGKLTIDNDAGADISYLADGIQAFVKTGAEIDGGDGDDVLVGGEGADTISTGGGSNVVMGSLGADIVTLATSIGADSFRFNDQKESAYGNAHDTIENFDGISDRLDFTGLGANVTYKGNVAGMAAGIALLSTSAAGAFFDQQDHTLYIDLNHDKQFSAADDMAIKLDGTDSVAGGSLLF